MTPEEMQLDEDTSKRLAILSGFRTRLRGTVSMLAEQVPTSLRVIVERYYPLMGRSTAHTGASSFPKSCVRTKLNTGRTSARSKGDVLCFHIGNAILAGYENDATLMENQVSLLEDIATVGYRSCVVIGSDAKGYALATEPEKPEPEAKKNARVPAPKKS